MSQKNVEVVRSIYEAFGREDVTALAFRSAADAGRWRESNKSQEVFDDSKRC